MATLDTTTNIAPNKDCSRCTARKSGWFCDLPCETMAEFSSMSMHVILPRGRNLFLEGEESRGLYVVCSGELKLTASSRSGKALLVRTSGPGDVLGLSAALNSGQHEVTAQANAFTQLKTIRRKDFLAFLSRHAEVGLRTAAALNRDYLSALNDACRLALSGSITARVASFLLECSRNVAIRASEPPTTPSAACGLSFNLSLTHEGLASRVGTTRESVTRVLGDLKRRGVLAMEGRHVVLLKPLMLQSMVSD